MAHRFFRQFTTLFRLLGIAIGFVSAVIGIIVVVNLSYIYAPDFTYNG